MPIDPQFNTIVNNMLMMSGQIWATGDTIKQGKLKQIWDEWAKNNDEILSVGWFNKELSKEYRSRLKNKG